MELATLTQLEPCKRIEQELSGWLVVVLSPRVHAALSDRDQPARAGCTPPRSSLLASSMPYMRADSTLRDWNSVTPVYGNG